EAVNRLEREPARADALRRTLFGILAAAGRAPGPAPESAALDEASRQRLAALGYLGRGGDVSSRGFDRRKEDAKDLIAFFRKDQRLNKLVEDKKYPEARALCEEMLRQRPGFADCHLQMSKIAAAEAILSYRRALALDPGSAEAHAYLGSALASRAQWDEAIEHFQAALKAKPENAELHDWMGVALREKGRTEEALGHFREAVTLTPGLAIAHYNLGRALKQQGKLDEAVVHYRRALAIDPRLPAAHNS